MTRRINSASAAKLREWEEIVLYTYDDADTSLPKKRLLQGMKCRGTPTIGAGHTGKHATPGNEITMQQAIEIFRQDLEQYERAVDESVKVPLTDNQFGALVSFCFNVGIGAFKGSSLLKRLNKGEYDAVPYELLKWTKTTINGVKIDSKGLRNRRTKEIGLWGDSTHVAPSTMPAEPMKKPIVTKESVTWGAGIAATVTAGGTTIFDGAGPIQWALALVIVVTFGIGAYLFLQKRI